MKPIMKSGLLKFHTQMLIRSLLSSLCICSSQRLTFTCIISIESLRVDRPKDQVTMIKCLRERYVTKDTAGD